MMASRYAHTKQFKRHHRQLRLLPTRRGRLTRDIRRKIIGQPENEAASKRPLARAEQIRSQQQRQRGFHAPEVECIGKGKASAPYSSASKPPSSPPMPAPRAASSCFTPGRCRATPLAATCIGDTIDATQTPGRARLCRQGLSRPKNHKPTTGLHLRPEARRLRCEQSMAAISSSGCLIEELRSSRSLKKALVTGL
jgi:hypothetical protein